MIKIKKKLNIFTKMKIIKNNFKYIQIIIFLFSLYLFIIGIFIYTSSSKLLKMDFRFDNKCTKNDCDIIFNLKKDYKGPIYIYIRFKNFYRNNRKVMLSINAQQMKGKDMSNESEITDCINYSKVKDAKRFFDDIFNDKNDEDIIHPCGLKAFLYNDCEIKR
jgi:hypothetical protein